MAHSQQEGWRRGGARMLRACGCHGFSTLRPTHGWGGREEKEGGESKGGRWGQRGNVGRDQEGVGQDRGHQWGEAEGKPQKRGG